MYKLLLLLSIIIIPAVSVSSDENCSVGFGEYGPLHFSLPSKKELFKTLDQIQIAKNRVNETASLRNGIRVEITQSGCSHHTITVKIFKAALRKKKYILDQAIQSLISLPAEKGSQLLIIADELRKMKKEAVKDGVDFNCGVGTCTLKRTKGHLEIIYDFAV